MTLQLNPEQAQRGPLTSYQNAFADELEAIYGRGVHDLAGIVAALNETGVRLAGGEDWTTDSFTTELSRLANEGHRR